MSELLDEPLQGLDTKICPLDQPLLESERLVTNLREGMWTNKLNLSFWLILTV